MVHITNQTLLRGKYPPKPFGHPQQEDALETQQRGKGAKNKLRL